MMYIISEVIAQLVISAVTNLQDLANILGQRNGLRHLRVSNALEVDEL